MGMSPILCQMPARPCRGGRGGVAHSLIPGGGVLPGHRAFPLVFARAAGFVSSRWEPPRCPRSVAVARAAKRSVRRASETLDLRPPRIRARLLLA